MLALKKNYLSWLNDLASYSQCNSICLCSRSIWRQSICCLFLLFYHVDLCGVCMYERVKIFCFLFCSSKWRTYISLIKNQVTKWKWKKKWIQKIGREEREKIIGHSDPSKLLKSLLIMQSFQLLPICHWIYDIFTFSLKWQFYLVLKTMWVEFGNNYINIH